MKARADRGQPRRARARATERKAETQIHDPHDVTGYAMLASRMPSVLDRLFGHLHSKPVRSALGIRRLGLDNAAQRPGVRV
jgi:hypothetical protein